MLIEDSLKEFDGVKDVHASHTESTVEIEYDESQIDIKNIKKIIIMASAIALIIS